MTEAVKPGPRDHWREQVAALVETVKGWADPAGWVTAEHPKKMRDENREVFEVPSLFLQKGPSRLLLDPVAYDLPGTEGAVDLYLMPTYDDTASLYLKDGTWTIHYEFPDAPVVDGNKQIEVMELTAKSFTRVLDEITAHAVPSV